MLKNLAELIRSARGSSQTRLVVLVTAALTVIGVTVFAAQPWGGSDTAQAEDPPRICDFFPDYFLCEPTETLTPSNTPTITNTPTHTLTPTNTLTPTLTPTFIPKLTSTAPPKAIIGGGTGGATITDATRYMPMFNTGVYVNLDDAQQALPSDGAITHLFVRLDGAPGGGGIEFTLMEGVGTTNLSCVISAAATECSDRSGCYSYGAGDLVALRSAGISAGTPRAASWTAVFTPNASCPFIP